MSLLLRRLRGLVRSALFWSVGWGAAAVAILHVMRFAGETPASIGFLDILGMAFRVAVWGGIIGTLFSAVIGLAFRGRRLADLSPWRFAAIGTVAGGVGIPVILKLLNAAFDDGTLSWRLLQDDALLGSLLGGTLAGGSLWLAQRAERRSAGSASATRAMQSTDADAHLVPATAIPVTVPQPAESVPVCEPAP